MDFIKRFFGVQTEDTTTKKIQDLSNTIILDVRTVEEYQSAHIKGARNIDFYSGNFKELLSKLDKNKNYVLYCRSGNRSGQSCHLMKQLGFSNVENLGSLNQAGKKIGVPIE
ncbi:MAG: rhodanese-like domain-containing protein [Pseudobdellovibrionaceae bacterium]